MNRFLSRLAVVCVELVVVPRVDSAKQIFIPLTLVILYFVAPAANAQTFQGLGDLSGGDFHSRSRCISGDGSFSVGFGTTSNSAEAIRWSIPTGLMGLASGAVDFTVRLLVFPPTAA